MFSAPGEVESRAKRPLAGDTEQNLDRALMTLHTERPDLFPFAHRYAYRLTNAWNAWSEVLFARKDSGRTEAAEKDILSARNRSRVLNELRYKKITVLCGLKAQALGYYLRRAGFSVINVPHCGNKSLRNTYRNRHPTLISVATPVARDRMRVGLWADDLLLRLRDQEIW